MKQIIEYRIVENNCYTGPKDIEIATPHFYKVAMAFNDYHFEHEFGSKKLECIVKDTETGDLEIKILYHEVPSPVDGVIRYKIADTTSDWEIDDLKAVRSARGLSLERISESIRKPKDNYDYIKSGKTLPSITSYSYEMPIKRFAVKHSDDEIWEKFNDTNEIIDFLKGKPFGFSVFRLDENGDDTMCVYEESRSEDDPLFYYVNTLASVRIRSEFDDGAPFFTDANVYGDNQMFFKDLDTTRKCILSKIPKTWFNDFEEKMYAVFGEKLSELSEFNV